MNLFRIEIANQVIEVKAGYKDTSAWCKDFISENEPDFHVIMEQQDVLIEKKRFLSQNTSRTPSGSYLEFLALLRKITDLLIDCKVLLMHGATIGLHENAYIFTAPSGTGKTTHILRWIKQCTETYVINGDKPFLKIQDDGTVFACGSPWAGKENLYTNKMLPLKYIIIMERAEENKIEQISFSEAFPFLLKQIYLPVGSEKMFKTLNLINSLQERVHFFHFYCNNFRSDCFDVAYRALVK